uniref:Uncharacterized protein n=1 Tax=Arion vulgaris TaxID=1028688 RepID=A0A0B7BH16_9EUPU
MWMFYLLDIIVSIFSLITYTHYIWREIRVKNIIVDCKLDEILLNEQRQTELMYSTSTREHACNYSIDYLVSGEGFQSMLSLPTP